MEGVDVTTSTGFFGNMKNALCSMILGFLMVPAAIGILGWNENRAVCTSRAIDVGFSSAKTAPCDAKPADFNDNPVFLACPLENLPKILGNAHFNTNNDISSAFEVVGTCMQQQVAAYQCVEIKHTTKRRNSKGGYTTTTTYTYSLQWARSQQTFQCSHCSSERSRICGTTTNPASYPVSLGDKTAYGKGAQAGTFGLPESLLKLVPCDRTLGATGNWTVPSNETTSQPPPSLKFDNTRLSGSSVQTCFGSAKVGCMTVNYKSNSAKTVSILSKWKNGTFEPWVAPNYWTCTGWTLHKLKTGILTRDEFKNQLVSENTGFTWGMRMCGIFLMLIGFLAITKPIAALPTIIPCIGNFIANAVSCILFVVSLILTLILSGLTIGIAWAIVRPVVGGIVLGIVVLLVGVGIGVGCYLKKKKEREAANKPEEIDVTGGNNGNTGNTGNYGAVMAPPAQQGMDPMKQNMYQMQNVNQMGMQQGYNMDPNMQQGYNMQQPLPYMDPNMQQNMGQQNMMAQNMMGQQNMGQAFDPNQNQYNQMNNQYNQPMNNNQFGNQYNNQNFNQQPMYPPMDGSVAIGGGN
eukprot:Platyproteum_vivax@DN4903_c0_g1_i1.p1